MAAYLSAEHLAEQVALAADLPERPGATAHLQYVVTGGPEGDVRYHQVVESGRLVSSVAGNDEDADAILTTTWADSVAIAKGDLDANAAFMQGKVKVVGDIGRVMALIGFTQSPEYRVVAARLDSQTDY